VREHRFRARRHLSKPPCRRLLRTESLSVSGHGSCIASRVVRCDSARAAKHVAQDERRWTLFVISALLFRIWKGTGAWVDTDHKAAFVLEILSEYLIEATMDYQAGHGVHEFSAEFDNAKHKVNYPDDIMQDRNVTELATVALDIFDRAHARAAPVRVLVRHSAFETIMKHASPLDFGGNI
jgi:hypothetical protein